MRCSRSHGLAPGLLSGSPIPQSRSFERIDWGLLGKKGRAKFDSPLVFLLLRCAGRAPLAEQLFEARQE